MPFSSTGNMLVDVQLSGYPSSDLRSRRYCIFLVSAKEEQINTRLAVRNQSAASFITFGP